MAVSTEADEMRAVESEIGGTGFFRGHLQKAFAAGARHAFPEPGRCACGEMPDVHIWHEGGKWRASFMCLGCYEAPRSFYESECIRDAYFGAADMWEEAVEVVR